MTIANCVLSIAGRRLTGSTTPAALDEVKITWGRKDSVSQPSPSTATCRILLPEDPAALADMYSIGRAVEISSTVKVWSQGQARPLALQHAAVDGATSGQAWTPPPGVNRILAVIPPAAPTSTIGAWDEIPTCSDGQTWSCQVTLSMPESPAYVEIRPAYYQSPSAYPYLGEIISSTEDPAARVLTGSWTPPARLAGYWIGLAVIAQPAGKQWDLERSSWSTQGQAWQALNRLTVTAATVTPPQQADSIECNVFTGSITDTSISLDPALDRPVMTITASDILADLAHRRIGSDPWPTHTLTQRVNAIIRELGTNVRTEIDPGPGARKLAWKDVDSQPASSLLTSSATSATAILWASSHRTTGPYLRFEDPSLRTALGRLSFDGSKITITASQPSSTISAASILRNGVTVDRDNADAASVARLTWQEPGVNEKGERTLTERTIVIKDEDAIARIGYRDISITTDLVDKKDAEAAASAFYRSHLPGSYTLPSLTVDTSIRSELIDRKTLAAMLDATRRMGLPIRLTELPRWMAVPAALTAYLDGATYTYKKGRWVMNLCLTRSETTGQGLTWQQLPAALKWNQSQPLTWAITSSLTA